jgi:hypothetical protein
VKKTGSKAEQRAARCQKFSGEALSDASKMVCELLIDIRATFWSPLSVADGAEQPKNQEDNEH